MNNACKPCIWVVRASGWSRNGISYATTSVIMTHSDRLPSWICLMMFSFDGRQIDCFNRWSIKKGFCAISYSIPHFSQDFYPILSPPTPHLRQVLQHQLQSHISSPIAICIRNYFFSSRVLFRSGPIIESLTKLFVCWIGFKSVLDVGSSE